jgi:UDP-N-acetylglucosamine 2-epimerase (non-hydrolysing)
MRVMIIFGTRPEAIKIAPVVREFGLYQDRVEVVTVVTAQHRQMLDQVLECFHIQPDVDLDVMRPDQDLAALTSLLVEKITAVLEQRRPDLVLVQGDTTTALAAGLASLYKRIPVGHIEAGLRTGDRERPFPEEINRRLISVLASIHFAPTQTAASALLAENVAPETIHMTGNTVVDALFQALERDHQSPLSDGAKSRRLILVTAHRRENFGPPLQHICAALKAIVRSHPDVEVVFPVHLNPHVQSVVHHSLGGHPRIHLLPPLDYLDFVHLVKRSYLVLTDSGGIQEEAPAIGKPVLVMRRETERPEAVAAGTVRVVGTDEVDIVRETTRLLHNTAAYDRMACAVSPYGDGHAAERIVRIVLQTFEGNSQRLSQSDDSADRQLVGAAASQLPGS